MIFMAAIEFENVKIKYSNFAGRQTEFNEEGERNFNVVIEDEELAETLKNDGWNVKVKVPKDRDGRVIEGAKVSYLLPVKVKFSNYPPTINLVTQKGVDFKGEPVYNVRQLDEETARLVDDVEFQRIDLVVRPYPYKDKRTGDSKISAYLNEFWGLVKENKFASRYSNNNDVVDAEGMLPYDM